MKKTNNETVYFTETQTLHHFWIRLILLFEIIFFATILYRQLILGKLFGPWPVTNTGLVVLSLLFILPVAMLLFLKIQTTVTDREIRYKMVPFGLFRYHIPKSRLKSFSIKTEKKGSPRQVRGIQLTQSNGKQLFLPSKNPEKLLRALQQSSPQK